MPFVQRGQVDGAQLPALDRVAQAVGEPAKLLGPADLEPELDERDAVPGQHALELGDLTEKLHGLFGAAEAHYPLDTCPVVPGSVEKDDFTRSGQVSDVALQVPLGLLAVGRFLQGDHARPARVEVLGEALDRAALAGRVPAFEQDHQPQARGLHVPLQLEQLDLERALRLPVLLARQALVVGIVLAPGLDAGAIGADQRRALSALPDAQPELPGELVKPRADRRVRLGTDDRRLAAALCRLDQRGHRCRAPPGGAHPVSIGAVDTRGTMPQPFVPSGRAATRGGKDPDIARHPLPDRDRVRTAVPGNLELR